MTRAKGPKSASSNYAYKYSSLNDMKNEEKPKIDVSTELEMLGLDINNPPKRNDMYVVCPIMYGSVEAQLFWENHNTTLNEMGLAKNVEVNPIFGDSEIYLNNPINFYTWAEDKLTSTDTLDEHKITIQEWYKEIKKSYQSKKRKISYDIVIFTHSSESLPQICEVRHESDEDYIARMKYLKELQECEDGK